MMMNNKQVEYMVIYVKIWGWDYLKEMVIGDEEYVIFRHLHIKCIKNVEYLEIIINNGNN